MSVFLRYHGNSGRGLVEVFLTDEQLEFLTKLPKVSEDEFKVPLGLWPFLWQGVKKALNIEPDGPVPLFNEAIWKPKDPKIVKGDVPKVDLRGLPIELWHPEAPKIPVSDST